MFFITDLTIRLAVLDSATGYVVAETPAAGSTGRFVLPGWGRLRIQDLEPRFSGDDLTYTIWGDG